MFVKVELALTEVLQVSGSFPEIRAKGDCGRMKRSRKIVRKVCDTTCFYTRIVLVIVFKRKRRKGLLFTNRSVRINRFIESF